MAPPPLPASPKLSSYHRRLFFFLGVAGFFEGFDTFALTQILPTLQAEMALSDAGIGALVGLINIGSVLAYGLVRFADRWGRRRVLMITVLGYALATLLSAFSTSAWTFGALQLVARVFLVTEWAVATVVAAEEFPAERRGAMIGIIHGLNGFGAIACAGLAPALLASRLGWRGVYVVGALPLLLVALARRSLRETRRFTEQKARAAREPRSLFHILRSPWRGRTLQLALIWWLTYLCSTTAITFWKQHAVTERGMTDAGVAANVSIAAAVAIPLAFGAGKLIDVIGRRAGAAVIYTLIVLGTLGSYTLEARWLMVASLILGMSSITAVGVVLAAWNAELFPTDLRGDAFGWSNHLLGRTALILSPAAVGYAASHLGWARAVSLTTVFPAAGLALILLLLPETRGRELEETSRAVDGGP